MQALAQPNSPSLPQRPTCLVWYAGDSCDVLMQQYNEMVLEHQQKDWEASVATPLRKQIADQQRQIAEQRNQIKTLQLAIESQTAATLHSRARNRAGIELLGAILGMGIALFVALATFRRLVRNSIPVKFGQHASGNWDRVVPAGSE